MPLPPARVVLVEDQTIFRELLAEVLRNAGHEVVGQFSDGHSALENCPEIRPDLVLLDAILPDLSGLDVLAKLLAWRPRLPVVMVTAHARGALVQEAVRRGARGFVTKSTPLVELRRAVTDVLGGGRYYCSVTSMLLADVVQSPVVSGELTARQRQIVQLVARGLSSKRIAGELGISLKTVSNHRLQIRKKLDLGDIASWTRYAIEQGLVEPKA